MNSVRAERILQNQSNLAQRIFRVVPLQVFWTASLIASELARVEKCALPTTHVVKGCLNTLKEAGLVEEGESGHFRNCTKPSIMPKEKVVPAKAAVVAKPRSLAILDRLAEQASVLRSTADLLDELALEIDEAITNASSKQDTKLKALQTTLRELLQEE